MKLPENFEKDYFDLLTPVVTDETVKNRRNLMVASFAILLLYFLGKDLSEIRFLGIQLKGAQETSLAVATTCLLVFWLAMFVMHAWKDLELNRERKHLLMKHEEAARERIRYLNDMFGDYADNHPNKQQIKPAEAAYAVFTKQQTRTQLAERLGKVTYVVEYALPIGLSLICIVHVWLHVLRSGSGTTT